MLRRRTVRWVAAGAAVVGLAVLIPGSPVYLPNLSDPTRQHDGRSARDWVRTLDHPDPETRQQAIAALGSIGDAAPEAVAPLAVILTDDRDPDVRSLAALSLFKMAPACRDAVPALARALRDDEPRVRMNAAHALLR